MAREGRIFGRVSDDGQFYNLVQAGTVRVTIPIAEAHADEKLKRSIQQNKWENLP